MYIMNNNRDKTFIIEYIRSESLFVSKLDCFSKNSRHKLII